MARLSGLQRQVLSLYRSALRASRAKEQAGGEPFAGHARAEIDRHRGLDRKDIQRIEHLVRRGRRQLDLLSSAGVVSIQLRQAPGPGSRNGSDSGGGGGGSSGGSGGGSGSGGSSRPSAGGAGSGGAAAS